MNPPDPNYESLKGTPFERPLMAKSEMDIVIGITISLLIPLLLAIAAWIYICATFYEDSVPMKVILAVYTLANSSWTAFLYWNSMDSLEENRRRTRNGQQPWQQER